MKTKLDDEIARVEKEEGYRATPYFDEVGKKWTWGYGQTFTTEELAHDFVKWYMATLWADLSIQLPWFNDSPAEVKNVLCHMAYQMGTAKVLKFKKALEHAEKRDWLGMAGEMEDSLWAKQTPERAQRLIKRIEALSHG